MRSRRYNKRLWRNKTMCEHQRHIFSVLNSCMFVCLSVDGKGKKTLESHSSRKCALFTSHFKQTHLSFNVQSISNAFFIATIFQTNIFSWTHEITFYLVQRIAPINDSKWIKAHLTRYLSFEIVYSQVRNTQSAHPFFCITLLFSLFILSNM